MATKEKVIEIFRNEFEDDSLEILDTTNADDIEDWDSLANINLVIAMEKEFSLKFKAEEIQKLQNVGDMINLIETMLKNE